MMKLKCNDQIIMQTIPKDAKRGKNPADPSLGSHIFKPTNRMGTLDCLIKSFSSDGEQGMEWGSGDFSDERPPDCCMRKEKS